MLQHNETVPKHLRKRAAAYEASRRRFMKRTGKTRPSYMAMRALVADNTLSFTDLREELCVTSRERVRQIVDQYFADVRGRGGRRKRTGKNCMRHRLFRKRSALRRACRDFRKRSRIYPQLRAHCKNAEMYLRHVWNASAPSERRYLLAGKSTYALRITAAHGCGESVRLYAKTRDFDRRKVREHDQLAIILEIDVPMRVRELYLIDSREFLEADLSYVLIPVGGRYGNGGRKARFDWDRYRVSSL